MCIISFDDSFKHFSNSTRTQEGQKLACFSKSQTQIAINVEIKESEDPKPGKRLSMKQASACLLISSPSRSICAWKLETRLLFLLLFTLIRNNNIWNRVEHWIRLCITYNKTTKATLFSFLQLASNSNLSWRKRLFTFCCFVVCAIEAIN